MDAKCLLKKWLKGGMRNKETVRQLSKELLQRNHAKVMYERKSTEGFGSC